MWPIFTKKNAITYEEEKKILEKWHELFKEQIYEDFFLTPCKPKKEKQLKNKNNRLRKEIKKK